MVLKLDDLLPIAGTVKAREAILRSLNHCRRFSVGTGL